MAIHRPIRLRAVRRLAKRRPVKRPVSAEENALLLKLRLLGPGQGWRAANTCRVDAHRDYVYIRRVSSAKIVSLMKIVPCKEYADTFLDGNLYSNTVRYFRDRGYDEFEGAAFIHPDTLRIGSHTIPQEDLAGPVIIKLDQVADLNIFCMFSWRVPEVGDEKILIDLESQLGSIAACIKDFGPYTVVVRNTAEFLRRVDRAVTQRGSRFLTSVRGVVRYFDPDTHRTDLAAALKIPLFKQKKFAHQKEYRFVLQTDREPAGCLVLPIGDIRDIAFCMRTEDVYDSVKIEEKMDLSCGC